MNRDKARAIIRAVCEGEQSGDTFTVAAGCDVTVHAGRAGAPWSIQQVNKITIDETLVSGETRKGQRFAFPIEELRGAASETTNADKAGRKTGFM
ncbi:MAG: hypothetical protein JNK05_18990 [Myxococcales bacterium]|nr:hypothetical protein [Myxococcales bacterium]